MQPLQLHRGGYGAPWMSRFSVFLSARTVAGGWDWAVDSGRGAGGSRVAGRLVPEADWGARGCFAWSGFAGAGVCAHEDSREDGLEDVEIDLHGCPRRNRCSKCGFEFEAEMYSTPCPDCASEEIQRIGREELKIAFVEVYEA